MNPKIIVAFGFGLLAVAFFMAVQREPQILRVGLAGITSIPAWWPNSSWSLVLKSAVFFLIWVASSCLAIPVIVRAFFFDLDKMGWLAFFFFVGTYIFIYGLPKAWEWAWMPVLSLFASQIALMSFIGIVKRGED